MKSRLFTVLAIAPFLALAPTLVASTTWYVNGVTGSDSNNCQSPTTACKTIGHAVSLALSGDSIIVARATYQENLTISISLHIIGAAATTTIIDGGGAGTVFVISSGTAKVTLSNLTIRNGSAPAGGGIYNNGTLTISNSTVSGNVATASKLAGGTGGGIFSSGSLTVSDSTVSGNYAAGAFAFARPAEGGGVTNGYSLTIINSTLSGNRTGPLGVGGAIWGGHAAINNSTISGNSAFRGGGIAVDATIQNSIVANNSGGNCAGVMTSNGYNLSSDNTCNFHGPGDLNNSDPLLGALQNNGGPTQTMALLPGSPAIDAGNPSGCTDGSGHLLKTDQRGMPRSDPEDSGGCDMGAYERQSD